MKRKLTLFIMVCFAVACRSLEAKPLPKVTQAALDEMGITYGVPQMSGFVFVNGRYLPPPYTVTRRGNAVFINRYQIEQPVAWSYFDSATVDEPEAVDAGELDVEKNITAQAQRGEEDSGRTAPAKVSSIDALFSEDAGADSDTDGREQGAKSIRSIDDLFSDDPVSKEPAASGPAQNIRRIDDLFADEVAPRRPTSNQLQPQPANGGEVKSGVSQTQEQRQANKETLKKRLDDKRASYERALAKGELYFFNTSHNQINGNYGTARTLIEVLPRALRYSRSPSELMSRLRADNVYFIDLTTCEALYNHKTTFPLLQQRLENIKEMEYLKAAKKE